VASIDFLRQLQDAGLFVKDANESAGSASGQGAHAANAATLQLSIPDSIAKRREWVQSLPTDEKQELRHNLRLFLERPPKEQEALRDFDRQLHSDPAADDLVRITERFYEWWNTLSSDDHLQWDDEAQNRIALVQQFQKNQEQRAFDSFYRRPFTLKNPDDQALIAWMRTHAAKHVTELDERSPLDVPKGDGARSGRSRRELQRAFALWWSPQAQAHSVFVPVTEAELRTLLEAEPTHLALSKEKQEELEEALEKGQTNAIKLVRGWIQTACLDMLAEARSRLGTFGGGGRRGFDFQRGGGAARPSVDAGPRQKDSPPPPKD
jgi:hypothetical protein